MVVYGAYKAVELPWSNEDATAVTGADVVCNGVRLVRFTKSAPESISFTAAVVS